MYFCKGLNVNVVWAIDVHHSVYVSIIEIYSFVIESDYGRLVLKLNVVLIYFKDNTFLFGYFSGTRNSTFRCLNRLPEPYEKT